MQAVRPEAFVHVTMRACDAIVCRMALRRCWQRLLSYLGRGDDTYGWKPSSSSNVSIRVVLAYPLIEARQTAPCRAIRGDSISVSSNPPPLRCRAPPSKLFARSRRLRKAPRHSAALRDTPRYLLYICMYIYI